jgi:class III poly(R)-hydroxyalkanoic acid synthase PhaE subunit
MNEQQSGSAGPQTLLHAWLEASTEFWSSMTASFAVSEKGTDGEPSSDSKPRPLESMESALNAMRAFSSALSEPGVLEGLAKGINALPEVLIKMIQPAWNGFFHLQQEWMKRAERIGETTAAYNFENLDQEAFKAFTEVYEREFRQFLRIPQLGLTREYQERLAEAVDRFNIFQATMAEFVSLLYLPMEKSMKVMQDKLASMAGEGALPDKSKDFYNLWLKILEGHYMTLFKSSEYTETLNKTLEALSEFIAARREILQDALQFFPIPTQKDMDELYKEIYLLKKRVKELEQKEKKRQAQTGMGGVPQNS